MYDKHSPRTLTHRNEGTKRKSDNPSRLYMGINHFFTDDVKRGGGEQRPSAKLQSKSLHPEVAQNKTILTPLPGRPMYGREGPLARRRGDQPDIFAGILYGSRADWLRPSPPD